MASPSVPGFSGRSSHPLAKTSLWIAATIGSALALWPALRNLFSTSDLMPHQFCFAYNSSLIAIHVISDVLIGASYVAISATLGYVLYRARRDIPFQWVLVAFGLFIVACGFTHFMEVVTMYHAFYWLAGEMKVITAIASVLTAVMLPPLAPRVIELARAEKRTEQLTREVAERQRAEEAMRRSEATLHGVIEALRASEARERLARHQAEEAADSVRRLQSITEAALAHLGLEELLTELLHRLRGLLDADTIAILLRSGDSDELVVRAALGIEEKVMQEVRIPFGRGFAGRVAASRHPIAIDDVSVAEFVSDAVRRAKISSVVGAPLRVEGRVLGVVHVGSYAPRHFTDEEASMLQLAADRVALAIEHARLFDSEVRSRRELELRTAEVQRLNAELEERVASRTAELQVAVKELEAFSYSVSHDLRAPLRSIDGFSQILVEDYGEKLDAQGHDYLERVRAASQRMAELIDDLLQLSRVSRGELRDETVDLGAMAERIIAELREAEPGRKVEVQIDPGLVARGDPRLLKIALHNLLGNAWKFTGRRPEAKIHFGAGEHGGQRAFFVRDNGAGFSMQYAGKLFQPFQRLHAPREFEGTGIGLATVQRVIARHRGRVWAEGEPDRGATFYFQIGSAWAQETN